MGSTPYAEAGVEGLIYKFIFKVGLHVVPHILPVTFWMWVILETFRVSIKQPTDGQSREGGQGDFEGRLREFWACLIDPCNISISPSTESFNWNEGVIAHFRTLETACWVCLPEFRWRSWRTSLRVHVGSMDRCRPQQQMTSASNSCMCYVCKVLWQVCEPAPGSRCM